jgi:hypothetical protein
MLNFVGEKNNSEWQEYKNYINSFVNIKQAKRNKLLNTNLPKRRGNDLTDNDIENPESGFLRYGQFQHIHPLIAYLFQ